MNGMIGDEIAYTDVTELDQEEKAWLLDYIFPDILDLHPEVKEQMFHQLWAYNAGECETCGADEGRCVNSTCVRTRVTNKLHLYDRTSL